MSLLLPSGRRVHPRCASSPPSSPLTLPTASHHSVPLPQPQPLLDLLVLMTLGLLPSSPCPALQPEHTSGLLSCDEGPPQRQGLDSSSHHTMPWGTQPPPASPAAPSLACVHAGTCASPFWDSTHSPTLSTGQSLRSLQISALNHIFCEASAQCPGRPCVPTRNRLLMSVSGEGCQIHEDRSPPSPGLSFPICPSRSGSEFYHTLSLRGSQNLAQNGGLGKRVLNEGRWIERKTRDQE